MGLKKLSHLVNGLEESMAVIKQLESFTELFYQALRKTVGIIMIEMRNRGLIQEPQEQPSWPGGLHPFRLQWGINWLIVVPISTPALAHPDFLIAETFALPEHLKQTLVGRLVLLYQVADNGTEPVPIGEVYVFPDGRWCTSGNIPPVRQDMCEKTLLEDFALVLFEGLTYSIQSCQHHSLQQTSYDSETQKIRYPVNANTLRPLDL